MFPDVLNPAIDKFSTEGFELASKDALYAQIATVSDIKRQSWTSSSMSHLPKLERFNGSVTYAQREQLYDSTLTPEEYALGCQIQRKLYDDALFPEIRQIATEFGTSVAETVETKFFDDIFNNGYVSLPETMTGMDGQCLFSASHPLSPSDASVQSNYTTNTLSHANVLTGILAMLSWKDSKGFLIKDMVPDILFVSAQGLNLAHQIVETENIPGSNNFANNMLASRTGDSKYKLKVMFCPHLTAYHWGLMSSKYAKKFCHFKWRIKPETSQTKDSDSFIGKWGVYTRFAMGFTGWQWVYQSFATS